MPILFISWSHNKKRRVSRRDSNASGEDQDLMQLIHIDDSHDRAVIAFL